MTSNNLAAYITAFVDLHHACFISVEDLHVASINRGEDFETFAEAENHGGSSVARGFEFFLSLVESPSIWPAVRNDWLPPRAIDGIRIPVYQGDGFHLSQ